MRILFFLVSFLFFLNAFSANEKLIFSIDIIRHGDRTPIFSIPSAPHEWKEGLGQLTAVGMQQEYQLGLKLHKRYMDEYHLLSKNYSHETMEVKSTDFDRTIMSAECVLLGLYPSGPKLSSGEFALPNGYQPIPIQIEYKSENPVIRQDTESEKIKALVEKYVYTTEDWKNKTKELQPKFAYWSQLTGVKITHLSQLKSLGDALFIFKVHHIPFPKNMSSKDANEIMEAGGWVMAAMFQPQKIGELTGKNILIAVSNYLDAARTQKSPLKFVLLSAHDSTILSVMSAMNAPLSKTPPYSSDLNIALFKADSNYFVKVKLNDQPVSIPACGGTVCTLEQFMKL